MNKKIIAFVVVIIIIIAGILVYEEYNLSKTQGYMLSSYQHRLVADNYLNQAGNYENNSDYSNAILMRQKSSDELTKALTDDNNAYTSADGDYKDYLSNDKLLLQVRLKLLEVEIYFDHQRNNDLNPGQENASATDFNTYINNLNGNITSYQDTENNIIKAHPSEFKFLTK